jgi:hypothetical protein
LQKKRKEAITPPPAHFNSRIDYTLHKMFLTEDLKTVLTKLKDRNCGPDAGPVAANDEQLPKTKLARINAVKRLLQLAHPCDTEAQLALLALVSTEATKFEVTKIISEEQLLTEARSAEKRPMALYEAGEDAAVQQERFKQLKWE